MGAFCCMISVDDTFYYAMLPSNPSSDFSGLIKGLQKSAWKRRLSQIQRVVKRKPNRNSNKWPDKFQIFAHFIWATDNIWDIWLNMGGDGFSNSEYTTENFVPDQVVSIWGGHGGGLSHDSSRWQAATRQWFTGQLVGMKVTFICEWWNRWRKKASIKFVPLWSFFFEHVSFICT